MAKKRASKEEQAPSKNQLIDEAIARVNQKWGEGSAVCLGTNKRANIEVISTGSIAIDDALGAMGLPKGRICEISGPESAGKTTFCLTVSAQCQKDGGTVAFIDVEHALDTSYAAKLGVDVSKLIISQPQWGEQALDVVETYVDAGVDLIVVDSVAALIPKSELDGQMGDASVGAQSRMMSQAMRRLTARVSKNKSVVLFTNQIREKIGVMFGSPETQPGGRALKFFASVRLDIRRQAQIKAGEEIIGNETKLKVVKNKVGPPYREALFQILYNKGINHTGSLINIGTEKGIIEKKGAWYSYNGELIGQGNAAACDLLNKNPELLAEIDKKVRDALRSE